jgi:hypothetical protein
MMEYHRFPEGEEPEVFTSISQECLNNDCGHCPGIFHVPEKDEEPVFCIHECHRKPN